MFLHMAFLPYYLVSDFLVVQPQPSGGLYEVYVRFVSALFASLSFPVEIVLESFKDPLFILIYLRDAFLATDGKLYLLVDIYPRVFILAGILYLIVSLSKCFFVEADA